MIHHYDHRWATYEPEGDSLVSRDVMLDEKQNSSYIANPQYLLAEEEVNIRSSQVPARLKQAYKNNDPKNCLKTLAEWVLGSTPGLSVENPISSLKQIEAHLTSVIGPIAMSSSVVVEFFKLADRLCKAKR